MIYVLIPNEIGTFLDIRVFENYSAVEQVMKDQARVYQGWGKDPDWCRVFAYSIGVDEYVPAWIFTVTPSLSIKRVPIR